ncbi:NUDIX hydrolase [Thomasclavelia cocleata]|uniref:NUDIX hydrolase n=1 Tax=Thomasclavelia cocleata TaxID=69824 RepID=UPI00272EC265|nr:NUDIX domain-containing protein [Thomasclavelia cocleata]
MVIIAGCLIVRNNKVLMVREAKKKCYGQWNGHVDELEKITDAAIREVLEETGCKVKLTGVLPICTATGKNGERLMVRFTADIIEENIKFDTEEILDVKWIDIEDVKNMKREELRGYDISIHFIKDFEENKIYPLEIFNNTIYAI